MIFQKRCYRLKFALIRVALLALVAVPLTLLTNRVAGAISLSLPINEIDYDQPSTDTAEFMEIKYEMPGILYG